MTTPFGATTASEKGPISVARLAGGFLDRLLGGSLAAAPPAKKASLG